MRFPSPRSAVLLPTLQRHQHRCQVALHDLAVRGPGEAVHGRRLLCVPPRPAADRKRAAQPLLRCGLEPSPITPAAHPKCRGKPSKRSLCECELTKSVGRARRHPSPSLGPDRILGEAGGEEHLVDLVQVCPHIAVSTNAAASRGGSARGPAGTGRREARRKARREAGGGERTRAYLISASHTPSVAGAACGGRSLNQPAPPGPPLGRKLTAAQSTRRRPQPAPPR